MSDKRPFDEEILGLVGDGVGPDKLIEKLSQTYALSDIIEALQRAMERHKIVLDSDGTVRAAKQLAEAA